MPMYSYECPECKHETEIFHSMALNPDFECAQCKHPKMSRVIAGSIGGFAKGDGAYAANYNGKNANHVKYSKKHKEKA